MLLEKFLTKFKNMIQHFLRDMVYNYIFVTAKGIRPSKIYIEDNRESLKIKLQKMFSNVVFAVLLRDFRGASMF